MTISDEPSTFEFCRDWLVSSECFVRDAMLADAVSLDEARDQARARIHQEESLDERNEDAESEHVPDEPPPLADRPRVIVRTVENSSRKVGTGTFAGHGRLAISVEVLVPAEHRVHHADDNAATRADKFKGRKAWARQLLNTIKRELHATSGLGENATPYLNGTIEGESISPNDPESGEDQDWIGWVWDVTWS